MNCPKNISESLFYLHFHGTPYLWLYGRKGFHTWYLVTRVSSIIPNSFFLKEPVCSNSLGQSVWKVPKRIVSWWRLLKITRLYVVPRGPPTTSQRVWTNYPLGKSRLGTLPDHKKSHDIIILGHPDLYVQPLSLYKSGFFRTVRKQVFKRDPEGKEWTQVLDRWHLVSMNFGSSKTTGGVLPRNNFW